MPDTIQHLDASRDDFEPEIPLPRWHDGTPKPQQFWDEHERGMVAHHTRLLEEHRVAMRQQAAERATIAATTAPAEDPNVPT